MSAVFEFLGMPKMLYEKMGQKTVKTVFSNVFWMVLERGVRLIGGFLVGIWLARYLGPTDYGLLNTFLAVFGILLTLTCFGTDSILLRLLSIEAFSTPHLLGGVILIRLVLVFLLTIMTAIVMWLFPVFLPFGICVLYFVSLFVMSFSGVRYWFESKLQQKVISIAETLLFLIGLGIRIALIYYQKPVLWFVLINLIEVSALTIFLVGLYYAKGHKISVTCEPVFLKKIAYQSFPLLIVSGSIIFYMKIDQIMLQYMVPSVHSGYYAVAARLSEIWFYFPTLIMSVLSPVLFRNAKLNNPLYMDRLARLLSIMTGVSYVMIIGVVSMSWLIVPILFGHAYMPSVGILMLHIFSLIGVSQGVVMAHYFVQSEEYGFMAKKELFIAIANIILNYLLIPYFFGLAAALTTVFCYTVFPMIINACFSQTRWLFKLQVRALLLQDIWKPKGALRTLSYD